MQLWLSVSNSPSARISPRVSERGLGYSASYLGDSASWTGDTCTPLTCGQTPCVWPLVQDYPVSTFHMISLYDIIVFGINFKNAFYISWRVQCPSQTIAGKCLCAVAAVAVLPPNWRLLSLFNKLPVDSIMPKNDFSENFRSLKIAVSLYSNARNKKWWNT